MTAMPSTKHPVLVSVDGTVSVEHNYMKKSEILLSSPKITVPLDKPGQLNDSNEPRSPDQINIFAGGWDDDEEDDYVDMAPLRVSGPGNRPVKDNEGPNSLQSESEKTTTTKYNDSGYYDEVSSESAHTRNDPHLSPRSILPSVVVLPASPHGSIPSQASNRSYKRTSMGSSSDSSSISSSSDSRSPEDSPFKIFSDRDNNSPEDNFESSNDPSTVMRESEIVNQESEGVGASSPLPTPPRVSVAGLAARKYLQMYKSSARSLSDSSKSSALQRSSSRVGTRGVQSRISKSRQQVTSPTRTRGSGDFEISSAQDERVRMEGGDKAVEDKKIKEDKKKSRTLDRDLRGTMLNSEMTYQHQSLEDLANGGDIELLGESKRRSKDGASVMRMIADRAKSQSLDGKYFEYLQGAAKHASAAPSKENSLIKSERKNSKSKNKKKKHKKKVEEEEEEEDEEEAYQKFAATMSSKTRSTGNICMMDVESMDSSLQGGRNGPPSASMSDIAVMRPKEKNRVDKLRKKKSSVSLAQRFSFRKSRTLGKLTSESKARGILMESGDANSELQPANGFQQIQEKENSPDSNDQPTTKPEKRKSWRGKRHGISLKQKSRDRMNSDPTDSGKQVSSQPSTPTKDPQRIFSDGDDTKQVDKKSFDTKPSIKQSLGFNSTNSPSLRPRKVSDDEEKTRTTSSERRTPVHSPKIMSPSGRRASTLGRGMSGMSNTSHIYRVDSTGHLGAHQPLKGVNSLNSENSGSNSDISLQYDEDMDDRRDRKAGTLTRLLGRKMRDKRYEYPDVEDESSGRLQDFFNTGSLGRRKKKGKSATLGSPAMALRMRHAHSREALLEVDGMSKIDMFFRKSEFVRGFRVVFDDYEDSTVIDFETSPRVDPNRINKYATITGIRSPSHGNYDSSSRKTQDTAGPEEPELDGTPTPGRRNNSMSVVVESPIFRPRSIRIIKRPQGPSGHLAFNEVLTEDEVVGNTNDQLSSSPLLQRNRRRQAIEPLIEEPSAKILAAGKAIYRHLVATNLELLKTHFTADERDHYGAYAYGETIEEENKVTAYANSFYGQELVTWLIGQFKEATNGQDSSDVASKGTLTRENVIGMVQALLEEGAISHVRREHHFQDTLLLYQFHDSVTRNDDPCRPVSLESTVSSSTINSDVNSTTSMDTCDTEGQDAQVSDEITRTATVTKSSRVRDDQELKDILSFLQNVAPDAMFRMVLRKLPEERTAEELMMIYEEILRVKALAHLSDSVKRELAGVLKFEFHRQRGKTLFSQGDEGRSWYIIVKGSVDVDIQGQGVVCTLHEGDDFGNLAIINDAPRAATIVLAEDNCQFLRVDKHDFVRILKDVEANTVRLKEHDKDVLILQKIHTRSSSQDGRPERGYNKPTQRLPPVAATPTRHHHRYAISAGTPAKIVEHVVKSLKPWSTARQCDEPMEDLILMYQVFMSTQELCNQLMKLYQSEISDRIEASSSIKRKVVYFVVRWSHIATHLFHEQPAVGPFLKELKQAVMDDVSSYPNLKEDLARVYQPEPTPASDSPTHKGWITVDNPTVQRYPQTGVKNAPHKAIRATDDVMLKVFNAQRTYTTVRLPIISTVSEIISAVAEKQGRSPDDLLLIHVKSDGDMYVLPKNMTSAATSVGVNSRFFICSADEKDDIEPLAEQHATITSSSSILDLASSQEIAEHVTHFDWELINSIHVMEFVHKVFGSHKFHSVTSNIDVFARRFNQLAYWAPSEICACNNLTKRVHLLRKFIKIAQHLKELQNMNAFMAVIIGLGNQALSKLHSTWDKLPSKYKKLMTEFEAILDPSRNHRTYRLYVANLQPPLIPYLPLLMKDMTFQHEGNDSMRNGLVNFEKMHMMSNSIRDVIRACSRPLELSHAVTSSKSFEECRNYTRNFAVITDQKYLNQISAKSEAKR